jgi:hypothetical protein
VRLFGAAATGLAGDSLAGQWRAYYGNVGSFLANYLWQCGTFGGGLRQAVLLSQACPDGPTRGRMDLTTRATWPSLWKDKEADRASTRKSDAEARAIDAVTLGLTPGAFLRHDPTVQAALPSLDVDDGPLPEPDPLASPGANEVSALGSPLGSKPGQDPAVTPAKALTALGKADDPTQPAATTDTIGADVEPPAVLPADIHTEAEIAAATKMSRPALRKVIAEHGIRPIVRGGKGARGGDRYSLGEVLTAWRADVAAVLGSYGQPKDHSMNSGSPHVTRPRRTTRW